jgi:soluble lytic murein transglycosylase-like protein
MADAVLKSYAETQANAYGIPPQIFTNLIQTESSWNPNAVSSEGAQGIAQLMPGTAPNINRFDPYASMQYAAQLLRSYFDKFGSWDMAVAAYNAGPGAVQKYGGVPPYPETQSYVSKILGTQASTGSGKSGGNVNVNSLKILFWAAVVMVTLIVVHGVAGK